jgi:hypothetical protein
MRAWAAPREPSNASTGKTFRPEAGIGKKEMTEGHARRPPPAARRPSLTTLEGQGRPQAVLALGSMPVSDRDPSCRVLRLSTQPRISDPRLHAEDLSRLPRVSARPVGNERSTHRLIVDRPADSAQVGETVRIKVSGAERWILAGCPAEIVASACPCGVGTSFGSPCLAAKTTMALSGVSTD